MKKICLLLAIVMLVGLLAGCGSQAPRKGHGNIELIDGWNMTDVDFKFINDGTMLEVDRDGEIYYIPITSVYYIHED